jgi:putative chitinase
MTQLTLNQLKKIIPKNNKVDEWHASLTKFMPQYNVDTSKRMAAFLAQCAHESGGFSAIRENLNYRPDTLVRLFKKYFDLATAQKYCAMPNKQEAIANRIYANRMGNGNEASGDGFKYRGRGLIQLTGKDNYSRYAKSLDITLDAVIAHLETVDGCVQSACWFWKTNNLNRWADSGDLLTLTKRINGGTIGLEDRIKHYNHVMHILGE